MQEQEKPKRDAQGALPSKKPLEPEVTSAEASEFMQRMHEECRGYDVRSDEGKRRLRAFLEKFGREDRERLAYRVMTDLIGGHTPDRGSGEAGSSCSPPQQEQSPAPKK